MSERSNRIAKNTFMLYLRMAFGMIVSLYTSRVVINALGIVDFGINNTVGGFVGLFSFLIYSMQTATQRFLNVAIGRNDTQGQNDVFSVSMLIHIGISVIILIIGETIGLWFVENKLVIPDNRMTAALWVYQFTLFSTVVTVMSIPFNAEVVAHEKMDMYAYLSILTIVLKLVIVYLLVLSPYDKLITYSLLFFCVSLLNYILFTLYCKRTFSECHLSFQFPHKLFREMTSFAGWDLFGVIAWTCSTQGTTILLNLFFGPAVNAAKGVAEQVKGAVQGFSSNFLTALNQQVTKSHAANDTAYLHKLMYSGAKMSFVLLFIIMVPLGIKAPLVLRLWLKLVPDFTVIFLQILLLQMVLDAMMSPLNTAALATGRIRYYGFATSVMTICIVPICYIVLKMGANPVSVFVIDLAMTIARECVQFFKLRHLVSFSYLDYFKKVQSRCLVVAAIAVPFSLAIAPRFNDNFLGLVLFCLCCCPVCTILCLSIVLNKAERKLITSSIQDKFSKR